MVQVKDKSFEVYISADQIADSIQRVAAQLHENYAEKDPFFICVLNGAFMFFSDLMKELDFPCEVGFIKVASYVGMESTGKVKFHEAGNLPLEGRHVVIIEDIVDTGNTLHALHGHLAQYEVASLEICTLLFKREAYQGSLPIDYVCFETKNKFLLGFGLDYDGYGRNLPEVYILND